MLPSSAMNGADRPIERGRLALGAGIRRARQGQGMSQDRLAMRSQLDQTTISKLESGRVRMRFTSLIRVLDALEVARVELYRVVPPAPIEAFLARYAPDGHEA